jgi:stress response protein YsnF
MAIDSSDSEIVIPLYTEDVSVQHRKRERYVRVHVQTVNQPHLVDENIVHESIEVERVAIGQQIDSIPPVRQEGDTTIISVVEEVVVVERRLILKEEIRLHRVRTNERYRETVMVREQQAVVERTEPGESKSLLPSELAPIPKPQVVRNEDE